MGDAAGELAHRLHLLRLGELRLEPLLFGQIDDMADRSGNDAALIFEPSEADRGDGLVAAANLHLDTARQPVRKPEIGETAQDGIARFGREKLGNLPSFET